MSVADTSFIIRAIELQELERAHSEKNLVITAEVKEELESKDADTIRQDRKRVEELVSEKPKLGPIEFEQLSAFADSASSFLIDADVLEDEYFDQKLSEHGIPNDLEKGELTCAVKCKERDQELLIDDFVAYSDLYMDLNGNILSLCEFLIENVDKDIAKYQRVVVILEELFMPFEDMSLAVKSTIRRDIEDFLDSEFNELRA